ncbi:hypothetical protein GCM10009820_33310 [Leifsonia soli]
MDAVEMCRWSDSAPAVTGTSAFIEAMMYRRARMSVSLSFMCVRDSKLSRWSASRHSRIAVRRRRICAISASLRSSWRTSSCRGSMMRGSVSDAEMRFASRRASSRAGVMRTSYSHL